MPKCGHCKSPLELLYINDWADFAEEAEGVYVCPYCGRHYTESNGSWLCEDDGEYIE